MMKHSKHGKNEKARHLMRRTGYAIGGAMPMAAPMPGAMPGAMPEPQRLKEGGAVEGKASGGRLDKMARGGRKGKAHVTVNVMNHPQTPISPSIPPIPVGLGAAGGGPRPMPSPAPMGGGAPGVPPMGPGGMKRGGRHKGKMSEGGEPTQGYSTSKIPMPKEEKHLATGGRAAPKMCAGAGSGEGRLEKSALVKEKPKAK